MILFLLCLVFGAALSQSAEEETVDLWGPVERDVRNQLERLDKSTLPHNCHATCGFSIHDELVDYDTAKQRCENSSWIGFETPGGRQLASIHSELENRIASLILQYAFGEELEEKRYEGATNWAWIGLEKENRTDARPNGAGKVVWDEGDWRWVDGQTLDQYSYTNWMDKNDVQVQPDMRRHPEGDHQTAARIFRKTRKNRDESGIWDDTFKFQRHPYICKFHVPVHYIVYSEGKTWHEAKEDCENRGFFFAKIRNKAENELFVAAAHRAFEEERHERKFHHFNWIWIGATDLRSSGTFEYYDGEQIEFTVPWAKKQHDNKVTKKQGSQDYVAVSRWGEWDDSYGDDWKRPYACQCNPQGIAIDQEMERINDQWEKEAKLRETDKERRKAAKAANKEERKKKKEERRRRKEERKQNKKEREEKKEQNKNEKQARIQENQRAKEATKAERQANIAANKQEKAAKKSEKQAKKKENQRAKADKKAEKQAKKAENRQAKSAKKAENQASKADKKLSKSERKANKKARKGDEEIEKREQLLHRNENTGNRGMELEKREQWADYGSNGGRKNHGGAELEKREQLPDYRGNRNSGMKLEKREQTWERSEKREQLKKREQLPDYRKNREGMELEKREQTWERSEKREQLKKREQLPDYRKNRGGMELEKREQTWERSANNEEAIKRSESEQLQPPPYPGQ